MSKVQCFKSKPDSEYGKAIKEHFTLLPKWGGIYTKVGELLGEEITRMATLPHELYIDLRELTKEENKKLFTKDGKLKRNTKKANEIREAYVQAVKEAGLDNFKERREINFIYGFMRMKGQELESFVTSDRDIYFKADFDLEKKTDGMVEPISEVEYQEKYLSELKKREEKEGAGA